MKVLFTQDALVNAGAERSHLEILSRFSSAIDVGFVYFYPKHELKEAYERAGIRLFFLNIPESYHFLIAVSRLVLLIRSEKPDLLISSLWRADIITRLASVITGIPLVGTLVNDSYSPIAWSDKKGLKYKLVYWLDRWTASIPIHWIANAQALADSHVRTLRLSPDKISVVYRGRSVIARTRYSLPRTNVGEDEAIFSGKQSPNLETASTSENHENKSDIQERSLAVTKHFISYGRLLERKGFQDAIRAFSQVIKTFPESTLTIYGEGPFRTQLENQISELGLKEKVILPGKIPDPHCLLQLPTAHCFLFPSWYEGFSGALVEAMMAGIPIIASDIPMNLEAIQPEQTALVFPTGNWEALANKMKYAIENPLTIAGLGNQAGIVAAQRFDIEVIAKQYEATLQKVYQQHQLKRLR